MQFTNFMTKWRPTMSSQLTQTYLELVLVKDAEECVWDEEVESSQEAVDLVPYATHQSELSQGVQVLKLVLICHCNLCPV